MACEAAVGDGKTYRVTGRRRRGLVRVVVFGITYVDGWRLFTASSSPLWSVAQFSRALTQNAQPKAINILFSAAHRTIWKRGTFTVQINGYSP